MHDGSDLQQLLDNWKVREAVTEQPTGSQAVWHSQSTRFMYRTIHTRLVHVASHVKHDFGFLKLSTGNIHQCRDFREPCSTADCTSESVTPQCTICLLQFNSHRTVMCDGNVTKPAL